MGHWVHYRPSSTVCVPPECISYVPAEEKLVCLNLYLCFVFFIFLNSITDSSITSWLYYCLSNWDHTQVELPWVLQCRHGCCEDCSLHQGEATRHGQAIFVVGHWLLLVYICLLWIWHTHSAKSHQLLPDMTNHRSSITRTSPTFCLFYIGENLLLQIVFFNLALLGGCHENILQAS